jgi:hypothetical protein
MAQTTTLNGVSYSIPDPGDNGWGAGLTSFLVAIAPAVLQKTGGTFTLTAPLSFGGSFGITALSVAVSGSTANTVPYFDGTKTLISSAVTPAELGYVSGVTSAIQTQINTKATDSLVVHLAGTETITGQKSFSLATLFADGTAALPGVAFSADTNTGLFRSSSDELDLVAGGVTQLSLTPTSSSFSQVTRFPDGTAAIPSMSFNNDPDSGMYSAGANSFALTAGGVAQLLSNGVQVAFNVPVNPNGDLSTDLGQSNVRWSRSYVKSRMGTITNDSAISGAIGEYIESVGSGTNFPTSNDLGDATSISLTAGDWDITAIMVADKNGSTWSRADLGISVTSGNSGTGLVTGSNRINELWAGSSTTPVFTTLVIPSYRLSLSSSTTVYMKVLSTYTVGTPAVNTFRLSARRVR